jgi:hypothetical protein
MKIVPANDTIADLKKKAAEYEEQAAKQRETVAALLRGKAKLCREWDNRAQEWQVDVAEAVTLRSLGDSRSSSLFSPNNTRPETTSAVALAATDFASHGSVLLSQCLAASSCRAFFDLLYQRETTRQLHLDLRGQPLELLQLSVRKDAGLIVTVQQCVSHQCVRLRQRLQLDCVHVALPFAPRLFLATPT